MSKYINADKLIFEIKKKRDSALERQKNLEKIGQETVLNEMIAAELNRLISLIASLQQEQPVENPQKGRFVFPKFLYARTVDNKTIDVSYVPQSLDAVEYVKNNLTKQPVEGLEEEIKRIIYDVVYDLNGPAIIGTSEYLSVEDIADIARYFAEWGAKQKSIKIFKKQNCQGCGTQRCTGDGEWLEGCKAFQAWKAEHLKK